MWPLKLIALSTFNQWELQTVGLQWLFPYGCKLLSWMVYQGEVSKKKTSCWSLLNWIKMPVERERLHIGMLLFNQIHIKGRTMKVVSDGKRSWKLCISVIAASLMHITSSELEFQMAARGENLHSSLSNKCCRHGCMYSLPETWNLAVKGYWIRIRMRGKLSFVLVIRN